MKNECFLLLGSNQGDRLSLIQDALVAINMSVGIIASQSNIYETAAWGKEELPPHLNVALKVVTQLEPMALLDSLQKIEQMLGRRRVGKWGVRTMDIDIIFYEDEIIDTDRLAIPHPLMQRRNFVLAPLSEIAGSYFHPVIKKTVLELLKESTDELSVQIFKK